MRGPLTFSLYSAAAMVALVFTASSVQAQYNLGTITGRVSDAADAVIPGCDVQIKNLDTGVARTIQANGDGLSHGSRPAARQLSSFCIARRLQTARDHRGISCQPITRGRYPHDRRIGHRDGDRNRGRGSSRAAKGRSCNLSVAGPDPGSLVAGGREEFSRPRSPRPRASSRRQQ